VSETVEYQTTKLTVNADLDVLTWWKKNASLFPGLSMLAKKYLCVMATSAASERTFSLAGFVVDERRSSLKPQNVNNILLVNSALR
jgi:hypothetical protein